MKFPVTTAIAAAFAYMSRHWLLLLRALWLPTGLYVAAQLYALPKFFAAALPIIDLKQDAQPQAVMELFGALAVPIAIVALASALFQPMMIVASLKHLVRGEEIRAPFYLGFGGDELRVFGAYVLLSAMVIVISIVGGLAFGAVAAIAALAAPAIGKLAVTIGDLMVNIVTAWFRLRLSVLYPAALATRTLGFGPAWIETKGRVVGLLGFWILIGLSILAVSLVFLGPVMFKFAPMFMAVGEAGADEAAARAALRPLIAALAKTFRPDSASFAPFAIGLYAATLAATAVGNVAAGVAWRYLGRRDEGARAS